MDLDKKEVKKANKSYEKNKLELDRTRAKNKLLKLLLYINETSRKIEELEKNKSSK